MLTVITNGKHHLTVSLASPWLHISGAVFVDICTVKTLTKIAPEMLSQGPAEDKMMPAICDHC
jgi:hypothetical protein